jgi:hypothetical protein
MTIAAGFRCNDGLVLCADTQLSGYIKHDGQKLWTLPASERFGFAMVGAGDIVLAKAAWEATSVHVKPTMTLARMTAVVQRHFRTFYADNIHKRSGYRAGDFGVIFAMRASDGLRLFTNSEKTLAPVQSYMCIGTGAELGCYLAETFHSSSFDSFYAKAFASYMLQETKRFCEACGGESVVLAMKASGPYHRTQSFETDREAKFFGNAIRKLPGILYGGLCSSDSRSLFEFHLREFQKSVSKVRDDYWDSMSYVRDAIRGNFQGIVSSASRGVPPEPPRSKGRKKRQPPSRE